MKECNCKCNNQVKEIKVKYLPGAHELVKKEHGDWVDMYAYKDYEYQVGDFFMINLGVAMELPEGYEAHLAPRSSMFKNFGLIQTNHVGVIDESFKGNNDIWHLPVFCLAPPKEITKMLNKGELQPEDIGARIFKIHKGDRLCQFRIIKKMEKVEFVTVDDLGSEDRGGFGSTGKSN